MTKIDHTTMSTYVDGKLVKEGKKEESSIGKFYWWKAKDEDEMAAQIAGTIKFIGNHQTGFIDQLIVGTRLYGQASAFNFIGPAFSRSASSSGNSQSNRLSFNLCSSVIDTLTSKVAKNTITPTFITSGGVWEMQKKAEDLTKFIEGCFYENDIHTKGPYAFRDSGMWGAGLLHVFENGDEIGCERAFPHEMFVDEREALSGDPRQLHRIKICDRDVAMEKFAIEGEDKYEEIKEAIETADTVTHVDIAGAGSASDLITISESWHLRSGKEATDGLHVICAGSKVIFKEEWKKDYFPFPMIHYKKRPFGFWGQGACESLANLQGEINRGMILEQRSRWMQSSFKILVENGSKVVSQHLNNEVGNIIHYTGTPPQYVTPPAIDASNREWIDSLIAKGFQQEGVSQLAASSLKPQGLDSGAALRNYDDIADDRFLFTMKNMEQFYLEIARQMIEVAKDIYKRKKTFKVVFPSTKFMETIDWKDINLKENEYVLKQFPTSSLPEDPSSKLQTVQEYMQAGLLSPRSGRKLLSMPDIEMSDKLANAAEDLICKTIEDMLNDVDKYRAPEPYWDLQLARQLALEYYNYAELNNCPQENLTLLDNFLEQIDDLTGVNAAPTPAIPGSMPTPGAGTAPQANPTPTPVSPLLPNQPTQ